MARIRTIKPEFPQSESMGRVSRDARLCFIMLWTVADDAGRLRGNSRMLASLLFPYDDDAKRLIDKWMAELEAEHCIQRYTANGDSYVQIVAWHEHQKIDKPSKSKFPEFSPSEGIREDSRGLAEDSPTTREVSSEDQRKGMEGKGEEPSARAPRLPPPDDVDPQTWADWLALRKAKKAPVTATVVASARAEAVKAGMTLEAFLRVWCARGSQGLQADWLKPNERPSFAVAPTTNGAPSVAETMAAQAAQRAEPRADPAKARAALALARSAIRVMP